MANVNCCMLFIEWISILLTHNGEFAVVLLVIHCFCDKTTTVKCDIEKNLLWIIYPKRVPNDAMGGTAHDQSWKLRSHLQLYTDTQETDSKLEVGSDTHTQCSSLVIKAAPLKSHKFAKQHHQLGNECSNIESRRRDIPIQITTTTQQYLS